MPPGTHFERRLLQEMEEDPIGALLNYHRAMRLKEAEPVSREVLEPLIEGALNARDHRRTDDRVREALRAACCQLSGRLTREGKHRYWHKLVGGGFAGISEVFLN